MKVLFMKTSKNMADVFTKNMRSKTYYELVKHFLMDKNLIRS